MSTSYSIPQARIVRKGGQLQPVPPAPPAERGPLAQQLHNAAAMAIGLWPLTGVVLLMAGLLWIAGMSAQP